MAEPKVRDAKLSEFQPDDRNANQGTERGRYMLETSLERVGAGRGIVVDKHGKVIAGNKTQEVAIAQGIEDAIVVETDGTRLVVTKRTDLDLDDPDPNNLARQYAYLDNRAGEVGLSWDAGQLQLDLEGGFDFDAMFRDFELDVVLGTEPGGDDWADAFDSLPDGDRAPFQQMTFTLHDDQVEQVKEAVRVAKAMGDFVDSPNENGNGNGLARVCELFIGDHGQG